MHGRQLAAISAAAAAGAGVLAVAELAAFVLYRRLLNGSTPAFALLVAIFTAVGGYAAWLIAVVVFSGVRMQSEESASDLD